MPNAITNAISYYKYISTGQKGVAPRPVDVMPLDIFLDNIRSGHWQDIVLPIRAIQDEKQRAEAKKTAPYVTISGVFRERTDNGLLQHSNFIAIDVDEDGLPEACDVEAFKEKLRADVYVVTAFTSIGGRGLCIVFKIDSKHHREAHQGISEYITATYKAICDPTSVNVSRARFVSYDPHMLPVKEHAQRFTQYAKTKPPQKIEKVVFDKSDFEQTLKTIVENRLNLAEQYATWLAIGFALAHKFGEAGRAYYHIVSQYSSKYNAVVNDKQFDIILKRRNITANEVTISTFYYYCKQAGVEVYSARTKKILHSAMQGKRAGLDAATIAQNLKQFEQIEDAMPMIEQALQQNVELNEDTLLDQLELYMRSSYNLKRNVITRYIESDGAQLQQKDLNTIYIKAKKVLPKITYDLMDRLINSDFATPYNAIQNFFEQSASTATNAESATTIYALFASIVTPESAYALHFGRKWLVSIVASAYGQHSPLMLVLSGEKQNTGKTEFFRRLLPAALRPFYAESKLDAGKDDEILMTQKLLIMDDEMSGKSKRDERRLKELLSKQVFSLREPYGRNNIDLQRLAVLCGTTNDNQILNDPTGNRRILPIHVTAVDHAAYNAVDKEQLFAEAYMLYKRGFDWQLTGEDIAYLANNTEAFNVSNSEAELLQKYFEPSEDATITVTEIKVYIEAKTNQRLSLERLGKELQRLGYTQRHARTTNGSTQRVYFAKARTDTGAIILPDDVPF